MSRIHETALQTRPYPVDTLVMTKLAKGTREGVRAERKTLQVETQAQAELVRASGGDDRKTKRIRSGQLRALGIVPPPAPRSTPRSGEYSIVVRKTAR